jgi:hypothetical protein
MPEASSRYPACDRIMKADTISLPPNPCGQQLRRLADRRCVDRSFPSGRARPVSGRWQPRARYGLLTGSVLLEAGGAGPVRDALWFRAVRQVHGRCASTSPPPG